MLYEAQTLEMTSLYKINFIMLSTKLIIEWSIFFILIAVLGYTMLVIKEEKFSFKDSAKKIIFHHFEILIPSWWGCIMEEKDHLRFERLDTRYDWRADYQWFESFDQNESIESQFEKIVQSKELIFDTDSCAILTPSDFLKHPDVADKKIDCVRLEGMATQFGTERKYVDLFLLRDFESGGFLWCQSISSILNGMVEGPYFEETILNIKKV